MKETPSKSQTSGQPYQEAPKGGHRTAPEQEEPDPCGDPPPDKEPDPCPETKKGCPEEKDCPEPPPCLPPDPCPPDDPPEPPDEEEPSPPARGGDCDLPTNLSIGTFIACWATDCYKTAYERAVVVLNNAEYVEKMRKTELEAARKRLTEAEKAAKEAEEKWRFSLVA